MEKVIPTPRRDVGDILVLGFGATIAMWGAGYLLRLPGASAPGWVVFACLLALLLAGGGLARRLSGRGAVAGLYVGLLAGVLNLLILGSLLGGRSHGLDMPPAVARSAPVWVLSAIAICGLCGFVGALAAGQWQASAPPQRNWPAAFALVASAATGLLLSLGGVVTGYQAGLAVPDWPASYGYNMFLYPLAKMTGGIYYEHAHRLFGALVGLTTVVLCVYVLAKERRRWVRGLVIAAVMLVIVQGIMGGLRVTEQTLTLAIIHGITAQLFFSLLVSLAVFLSNHWKSREAALGHASAAADRWLGGFSIAALLIQLTLGALLRHVGWGLHLHLTMAVLVFALVGVFALRSWSTYDGLPHVPRLGGVLLALLGGQLLLGVGSLVALMSESQLGGTLAWHVVITTAHQTLGAVLLATTTALWLWHWRLLQPGPASRVSSDCPTAAS